MTIVQQVVTWSKGGNIVISGKVGADGKGPGRKVSSKTRESSRLIASLHAGTEEVNRTEDQAKELKLLRDGTKIDIHSYFCMNITCSAMCTLNIIFCYRNSIVGTIKGSF